MIYILPIFLIALPVLVFGATPHTNRWKRAGRLILSVLIGYVALACIFYADYTNLHHKVIHDLTLPDHSMQQVDIAGAIFWHWLLCGWIWTILYVGWLELAWRKYYQSSMISLRQGLGDDRISNVILRVSFYATLLCVIITLIIAAS